MIHSGSRRSRPGKDSSTQGNGGPNDAFIPAVGARHRPYAEVGQEGGRWDRVRMARDSHGDWLSKRHFWPASQAHSAKCALLVNLTLPATRTADWKPLACGGSLGTCRMVEELFDPVRQVRVQTFGGVVAEMGHANVPLLVEDDDCG